MDKDRYLDDVTDEDPDWDVKDAPEPAVWPEPEPEPAPEWSPCECPDEDWGEGSPPPRVQPLEPWSQPQKKRP